MLELAQESGDLDAESEAVLQYQIAVTEAAHNVVLLHLLRCMEPMLAQNVRQNFELLYARREMLPLVSTHRTRILKPLWPENQKKRVKRHTDIWRLSKRLCWTEAVRRAVVNALYAAWNSARISFSGRTLTRRCCE